MSARAGGAAPASAAATPARPLHRPVASGVHAVDCGFEGVPLDVYVVQGPDGWALIDAGVAGAPSERIFPALAELGGAPAELRLLVNTHVHHDHRGGNGEVKRASPDVRIAVPEVEVGWAESAERYLIQTQLGAFPGAFEPAGAAQERIRRICGDDVVVDVALGDGDELDAAGRPLRVVGAPGHSPGHVVLHGPAASIVFAGDALQGDGVHVEGGSWLFPLYADVEVYARTLATLARLDAELVCTAHYGVLDRAGTKELLAATRKFMGELDADLAALLAGGAPLDLRAAVAATLRAHPQYRDAVGVYTTVAAHLDHMVRRGSVTASLDGGVKQWQSR